MTRPTAPATGTSRTSPTTTRHPEQLPDGSSSDQFVASTRAAGSDTLLTVPLIGWTPRARAYDGGFRVNLYGAQQSVDPWRPDFGNGVRARWHADHPATTPPTRASRSGRASCRTGMAHLLTRFGAATTGGVRYLQPGQRAHVVELGRTATCIRNHAATTNSVTVRFNTQRRSRRWTLGRRHWGPRVLGLVGVFLLGRGRRGRRRLRGTRGWIAGPTAMRRSSSGTCSRCTRMSRTTVCGFSTTWTCTTTRRPPTWRCSRRGILPRRRCGCARRARCGIQTTWMKAGSASPCD